jgi:histone H3/H4
VSIQVLDCLCYKANITNRGETEDLGRFHFDLNFPSPAAAPLDDPIDGDTEDFALSTADVQPLPVASDDDDAGGDFGFGLDFPPAVSPSESPGIVGGGLQHDDVPVQSKQKKISRHGIPIPNLPAGVVKKLATRFARSKAGSKAKINKATLAAIEQASSWYFEQASQDLAAYSKHAGRKTIDESDVTTLLRRSVSSKPSMEYLLTAPDNAISTSRRRCFPSPKNTCPRSSSRT